MLDSLSPVQWAEWTEFSRLEPWGSEHSDRVAVMLTHLVAQCLKHAFDANAVMESLGHRRPPPPKLTLEEERRQVEAGAMLFSMQLHGGG